MATYFGEVLSEFSRAVDEEDEDELEGELSTQVLQEEREVLLRWGPKIREDLKLAVDNKINYHSVIFAIGEITCDFLHRHCILIEDKPVGVISCGLDATDRNSISQKNTSDSSCFIYETKKSHFSSLVVIWHQKATSMQTYSVVNKLFQCLSVGDLEVFVLMTSHISEYKASDKEKTLETPPVLRSLVTDCQKQSPAVSRLEVPNFVTGLPAAVLSYCQVFDIRATLYVSYVEMKRADSINVEVFIPLLSAPTLSNYLEDKLSTKESQWMTDKKFQDNYAYI